MHYLANTEAGMISAYHIEEKSKLIERGWLRQLGIRAHVHFLDMSRISWEYGYTCTYLGIHIIVHNRLQFVIFLISQ
jgi:hypothetical protein